jgi:hypothetical protein
MSHGHLSKVERGEYGRPVTPAIVAAYERVTGVRLAEAVVAVAEQAETRLGRRQVRLWKPGELSDMRRNSYNAAICALSVSGPLTEPYGRLLDSTGRPLVPASPDDLHRLGLDVGALPPGRRRPAGGLAWWDHPDELFGGFLLPRCRVWKLDLVDRHLAGVVDVEGDLAGAVGSPVGLDPGADLRCLGAAFVLGAFGLAAVLPA